MTEKPLFANEKVLVTKNFDIHQDWDVPIPGFFIIENLNPRRSIAEFTDEELAEFAGLVRKLRRGMQDVLKIKDVYFFQNEDSEHGYHLWMFPRHDWMDKFGRKIQSVRPIIEFAKEQLATDKNIAQTVRQYVQEMKIYMQSK